MANATELSRQVSVPSAGWISGLIGAIQLVRARHSAYRTVMNELGSLSDRELADINVSRLSVRDVARAAAAEVVRT